MNQKAINNNTKPCSCVFFFLNEYMVMNETATDLICVEDACSFTDNTFLPIISENVHILDKVNTSKCY